MLSFFEAETAMASYYLLPCSWVGILAEKPQRGLGREMNSEKAQRGLGREMNPEVVVGLVPIRVEGHLGLQLRGQGLVELIRAGLAWARAEPLERLIAG